MSKKRGITAQRNVIQELPLDHLQSLYTVIRLQGELLDLSEDYLDAEEFQHAMRASHNLLHAISEGLERSMPECPALIDRSHPLGNELYREAFRHDIRPDARSARDQLQPLVDSVLAEACETAVPQA